ncbi:ras-like protein [Anaeramoeba ignava]|uniref:Ras-like protein n=1 Tax=Anaeramoeba ignava TaxID=1746090 RepID=A0A9Q0LV43_ANAIG|nr:ras-like protein [Anaeramoeba ignava]
MSNNFFRIVIVGDSSVGKSSLTRRFLNNSIEVENEQISKKILKIENQEIMIEVIDTMGQEEFRSVRDKYYTIGDGFVVVYSILSSTSLNEAEKIIKYIKRARRILPPLILVENKIDLEEERIVPQTEGEELAKKFSVLFGQLSAKNGIGVDDCFQNLIEEIIQKKTIKEQNDNSDDEKKSLIHEDLRNSNSKKCCSCFLM